MSPTVRLDDDGNVLLDEDSDDAEVLIEEITPAPAGPLRSKAAITARLPRHMQTVRLPRHMQTVKG